MTFPDAAKTLVYLLADLAGGIEHAGTETPSNLQEHLPFIRVGRVGGADDGITDYPTLEVDFFAKRRDDAVAGAEDVRTFLTKGYHHIYGVTIDSVVTQVGPRELPWLATGVRRFTGTYRAALRRSS